MMELRAYPPTFTLRPDPKSGIEVVDERTGEVIAWRASYEWAGAIVDFLCERFSEPFPATDTLCEEIRSERISGGIL